MGGREEEHKNRGGEKNIKERKRERKRKKGGRREGERDAEREKQRKMHKEGERHWEKEQRGNRAGKEEDEQQREKMTQKDRERDRKGKSSWEKSSDVLHGKAICYRVVLSPSTVLCHMWEVNKAGTRPKNICPGLQQP